MYKQHFVAPKEWTVDIDMVEQRAYHRYDGTTVSFQGEWDHAMEDGEAELRAKKKEWERLHGGEPWSKERANEIARRYGWPEVE